MTGIRLLASSAGACFGNLDWDYKRDDDVLRFLRGLIYFASAFVVLLLCTSSYTYINAAIPHPPHMIITLIFLAGTLIYLGYLPGIRHAVTTVARRVRRALPVTNRQHGGSVKASRAREDKIVDWCIWTALGYLATAAIADAFVLTVPAHWWYQTAAGVVYAVAWVSLVMPLAVLGFAMGALAQD